jgi:hypothetical protein
MDTAVGMLNMGVEIDWQLDLLTTSYVGVNYYQFVWDITGVAKEKNTLAVFAIDGSHTSYGTLITGETDSDGIFRSASFKKLAEGTQAEVIDLVLAGFEWDPLGILDPTLNNGDTDGDGLPDEVFAA